MPKNISKTKKLSWQKIALDLKVKNSKLDESFRKSTKTIKSQQRDITELRYQLDFNLKENAVIKAGLEMAEIRESALKSGLEIKDELLEEKCKVVETLEKEFQRLQSEAARVTTDNAKYCEDTTMVNEFKSECDTTRKQNEKLRAAVKVALQALVPEV